MDECLQSVERALDGVEGDIFVVDNRSTDHTVETLRPKYPNVHFIANPKNVGFARANNQAIRRSDAEYVLLLNPDTVVYEPTIKGCLDFMDAHPEAGGAGVRMLTREGNPAPESRRAIPTPWVSMLKMLGFTRRYSYHNSQFSNFKFQISTPLEGCSVQDRASQRHLIGIFQFVAHADTSCNNAYLDIAERS